ncbi:hypothetical protein Pla22_29430 [Rubripirellula amarantea]|uniref:Squalene cyclase C-terminal domain-containing protein n=1 Tax=Rubripirellula amarantea TaxID=2527999 RepID=A0A5C5WK21_9BACT|nr:prenyltransferase/squalene oxidase repeat-containing protein [Rubripirellula amarantea]TWT50202.1 hypothetical protein Pla22_29430 [Rubripirellula amarantea]
MNTRANMNSTVPNAPVILPGKESSPTTEFPPQHSGRRSFLLAQSWLVSFIIHLSLLLVLALLSMSQGVASKTSPLVVAFANPGKQDAGSMVITRFVPPDPNLGSLDSASRQTSDLANGQRPDAIATDSIVPDFTPALPRKVSRLLDPAATIDRESTAALVSNTDLPSKLPEVFKLVPLVTSVESRTKENKAILLERFGGSKQSEEAVQRALIWLVNHQAVDGGWTFDHQQVCNGKCDGSGHMAGSRNGATGLALLPFLGAGETHFQGNYTDVVQRGIDYLLAHQERVPNSMTAGSWHESGGTMYSHCLASLAICEAYAMTGDSRLRLPAQASLDYLVLAQDPYRGGWRYSPRQAGDTSVVGWAAMALKSGQMADLVVPEKTLVGIDRFLDSVSTHYGSNYGYTGPSAGHHGGRATSAIGLLCRMYRGAPPTHAALINGSAKLAAPGPGGDNLYCIYYASQVLRHLGGPQWDQWNRAMRDPLISLQVPLGHAAGSWPPKAIQGIGSMAGGRLYSTCMATMTLEVYYRHMPLYSEDVLENLQADAEDDFEL